MFRRGNDWHESERESERGKRLIGAVAWLIFVVLTLLIVPRACGQDTIVVVVPDGGRFRIQRIEVPEDTTAANILLNESSRMNTNQINEALINRFGNALGISRSRSIRAAYREFNGSGILAQLPEGFWSGDWRIRRNDRMRIITLEDGGTIEGGGVWSYVGVNFRIKQPGRREIYFRIRNFRFMSRGPTMLRKL